MLQPKTGRKVTVNKKAPFSEPKAALEIVLSPIYKLPMAVKPLKLKAYEILPTAEIIHVLPLLSDCLQSRKPWSQFITSYVAPRSNWNAEYLPRKIEMIKQLAHGLDTYLITDIARNGVPQSIPQENNVFITFEVLGVRGDFKCMREHFRIQSKNSQAIAAMLTKLITFDKLVANVIPSSDAYSLVKSDHVTTLSWLCQHQSAPLHILNANWAEIVQLVANVASNRGQAQTPHLANTGVIYQASTPRTELNQANFIRLLQSVNKVGKAAHLHQIKNNLAILAGSLSTVTFPDFVLTFNYEVVKKALKLYTYDDNMSRKLSLKMKQTLQYACITPLIILMAGYAGHKLGRGQHNMFIEVMLSCVVGHEKPPWMIQLEGIIMDAAFQIAAGADLDQYHQVVLDACVGFKDLQRFCFVEPKLLEDDSDEVPLATLIQDQIDNNQLELDADKNESINSTKKKRGRSGSEGTAAQHKWPRLDDERDEQDYGNERWM